MAFLEAIFTFLYHTIWGYDGIHDQHIGQDSRTGDNYQS